MYLPMDNDQTFSVLVSKEPNEQKILSFVHRKLAWEVLGAHSGSLFEVLVTCRQIIGVSGDQAPVRVQPWTRL